MTGAMVYAAAQTLRAAQVDVDEIVTFVELGSEGALLKVGHYGAVGRREWLIARNGDVAARERSDG